MANPHSVGDRVVGYFEFTFDRAARTSAALARQETRSAPLHLQPPSGAAVHVPWNQPSLASRRDSRSCQEIGDLHQTPDSTLQTLRPTCWDSSGYALAICGEELRLCEGVRALAPPAGVLPPRAANLQWNRRKETKRTCASIPPSFRQRCGVFRGIVTASPASSEISSSAMNNMMVPAST